MSSISDVQRVIRACSRMNPQIREVNDLPHCAVQQQMSLASGIVPASLTNVNE
jgi:hypothetical protein